MTPAIDTDERTAAILDWQDRWTVALDDAFPDGWPFLDAAVSRAIAQLRLRDLLGLGGPIEATVEPLIDAWTRVALAPQVDAAKKELALLAPGPAECPLTEAPLTLGPPTGRDTTLARIAVVGWWAITVALLFGTIVATAAFTVVPFMDVVSTLLGLGCGAWTFGLYPERLIRWRVTAYWRERVQSAVLPRLRDGILRFPVQTATALLQEGSAR